MTKAGYLVLTLGLLGCDRSAEPAATPLPLERPAQVASSHAAGVAKVQILGPAEAAASGLALDGEGLRVFNMVSGASRLIPFGTAQADTLRSVGAAQKTPGSSVSNAPGCNATGVSWDTGLTVWFAKERLVGWSSAASPAPPATAAGIRVGATRRELTNAYAATFTRSTRGQAFSAGTIAGLLDSDRPGALITQLWAGQTCVGD